MFQAIGAGTGQVHARLSRGRSARPGLPGDGGRHPRTRSALRVRRRRAARVHATNRPPTCSRRVPTTRRSTCSTRRPISCARFSAASSRCSARSSTVATRLPRGLPIDHETYGTLVDRPFLMAIAPHWSAAVLRDPLVWYRHHSDTARHKGMHADHIIRLFTLYRATLTTPLTAPGPRAVLHLQRLLAVPLVRADAGRPATVVSSLPLPGVARRPVPAAVARTLRAAPDPARVARRRTGSSVMKIIAHGADAQRSVGAAATRWRACRRSAT